jgi:nitronate monooxygenase
MIVESSSRDIVYSNLFTGVHGNYLRGSIAAAGLDPDALPQSEASKMNFGSDRKKPWKDIWGLRARASPAITRGGARAALVRAAAPEFRGRAPRPCSACPSTADS